MTFNTMCDLCNKKQAFERFKLRIEQIADTINRHEPDLISLQEIRTKRQVYRIKKLLNSQYTTIFAEGFPLSYADPVLMIKTKRFRVTNQRGMWLGPRTPRFSFGHEFGIPRRIQFAEILDRQSKKTFIFAGSHFDNHGKNKAASADFLSRVVEQINTPFIFAADTNLKPDSLGYENLSKNLIDSFLSGATIEFVSNSLFVNQDACMLSKGRNFPSCRVDHIFTSHNFPWTAKTWKVDLFRYGKKNNFASDHRAIIAEFF